MKIKLSSPQDIGRVIRATRKSERIRQDDAAGAIGLSDVSLGRLENGAPGVRLENVLRVMNELGIELYAEVPDHVAAAAEVLDTKARTGRKRSNRRERVTA